MGNIPLSSCPLTLRICDLQTFWALLPRQMQIYKNSMCYKECFSVPFILLQGHFLKIFYLKAREQPLFFTNTCQQLLLVHWGSYVCILTCSIYSHFVRHVTVRAKNTKENVTSQVPPCQKATSNCDQGRYFQLLKTYSTASLGFLWFFFLLNLIFYYLVNKIVCDYNSEKKIQGYLFKYKKNW